MAQATDGNSVHIHYSGKLKDRNLFDSSEGGDPLQFTIGQGNIIPKLEAAVVGMAVGDKASVETVVALDETTATLDANHPLAGEDLFFEGELFGIKGVESSGA